MTQWTVLADALTGGFGQVGAPDSWFRQGGASTKPYARLTSGTTKVVLKVVATGNAEGTKLIVTPGTFGLESGGEELVEAELLSNGQYRMDWLINTTAGKLTVVGLLLALVGQAFQLSFDIGKRWAAFHIGTGGSAALTSAKDVLTIAGLALATYQVVLKS